MSDQVPHLGDSRLQQDWWGRLSFRAKLWLMVNLLLLLVIVGAAFLVESRQRIAIVQEVEKRAMVMAQALVSTTTSDLLTYNYVSIEQTVQQFGKKPDLVYAVVTDKEGTVAAQFVRNYPLTQLLDRGNVRKIEGPAGQQIRLPGSEHDVVYDVRLPVMVEGSPEPWGEVRLGVSLKAMYEEIDRTRWQIAGFGVMALALGSLGATLLAERMTRPIKPLMTAVAAVGRGEFDHRIGVASQDELGRLSAAFNDMSVQLGRVRELEERLRRADRLAALGTMAAGIAHDIRNPLTSILIFSQLMSLHHDDPEVREKFDRVVPRELERVQAVIEDMMELARPSSITLEPANMNEVIGQVLELFETQVAAHKIAVRRDFQRDLPFGMMDRKRMHRCLSNLVSNAIQAMPGGGDLVVETRHVKMAFPASRPPGTKPEQAIRVTVSDTGQGIPADRLSRIFDPFYTTKEKGVGLGMAITHRIVEDHKGTIDVASEVGKGTAFTLHFPVSA